MGERKGRVELAKVDVDKLQELAMQYDVSNCPPSPPLPPTGEGSSTMVGINRF